MHGSILVPYYPWQLSHRRHHMYHNHIDKDYSHPWYTAETLSDPKEAMSIWLHNWTVVRFGIPIFGWPLYLYGKPDGCHLIPFSSQRMWAESPSIEYVKCVGSAAVVLLNAAGVYYLFGQSLTNALLFYTVPWIVFGWWLVTVTYLQHHSPGTVVYNDDNWKFVNAAFETVDRVYGFGLDSLHHHISDGHVVHHLFFTKIPHYNLPIATAALTKYLKENGLEDVYKFEESRDFAFKVHQYCMKNGFLSTMANEPQAVLKKAQ